jgi:cytochrome c biogenesis protein CcmG/thiol:disulfide interchange protein DsbE
MAAMAALALAWSTAVAEMPWAVADGAVLPGAEACPADAKKANLNFTLKDLANKDVSLTAYKGKVILLDFWATWCAPCKVEIPWFIEFQQKYGPRGFQVVGISVDDTREQLEPYVKEMKMSYPVLQGLGQDAVTEAYGPIVGLPVTALISRDGNICAKHIGMARKDEIERQIKALL